MILFLAPLFLAAYFTGVWGIVWFNLHVLDLGDPKFRTAVSLYFIFSSAFLSPAVIAAFVFLSRARQDEDWRLWGLAGIYLALIFAALEISWILDSNGWTVSGSWIVLLLEYLALSFLFWKIQRIMDRIRHV